MQKVSKYNGTAYRAIELNGTAITDFLNKHQVGSIVPYDDFVSCGSNQTSAFFNKPNKNIRLVMEVKSDPIISDFADGIKFRGYAKDELLLLRERKFKVLSNNNNNNNNGVWEISLVEQ